MVIKTVSLDHLDPGEPVINLQGSAGTAGRQEVTRATNYVLMASKSSSPLSSAPSLIVVTPGCCSELFPVTAKQQVKLQNV